MAFMKPESCYFTKEEAAEYTLHEDASLQTAEDYDPGAGWYGRLSAPGYLDATDWLGPFETSEDAIAEVCALFEVDEEGENLID